MIYKTLDVTAEEALNGTTVIHTMAFWDELSGSKAALVCGRNGLLFTIGFVGFLTGTFVSVGNIIDYFAGAATNPFQFC